MGVMTSQMLIWWQWKPRRHRDGRTMAKLILAYLIGVLLSSASNLIQSPDEYATAILVWVGFAVINLMMHWFALVLISSVKSFEFQDQWHHENLLGSDPELNQEIEIQGSEQSSRRQPISIMLMMGATLFAAIVITLLKWFRTLYGDSGQYPISDVGQVAWIMTAAIGNTLCIYAAAVWWIRRKPLVPFLLLVAVFRRICFWIPCVVPTLPKINRKCLRPIR